MYKVLLIDNTLTEIQWRAMDQQRQSINHTTMMTTKKLTTWHIRCFLFTVVIHEWLYIVPRSFFFSFLFFFCDPCRQLSLLIIPVIQPQENSPILYEPFGTIRGQLVPGAALTNTPVYKELQLRTRTSSKSKACANASPAVDNQPFPKRGAN